jgi:tetratricopeptide (TPR) repeat protein
MVKRGGSERTRPTAVRAGFSRPGPPEGVPRERRPNPFGLGATAAIFALALAVRLVHIWQIRDAPFFTVLMGDSRAYDEWAQRIAGGNWLGQDVFYQAPLYPYFLAMLYWFAGHDLLIVRICQAIVGSLACVLLALAGSRLVSNRVGLIAGLGLALYAPAIFFDALVQKSVLDVFFVCLIVWLASGLVMEPRKRRSWFWLGLAIGGLTLTRENAIVFSAVVLLWALVRRDAGEWRHRAATAGAFMLGMTIVLLPVALRNSLVDRGFYLTTSQFGPNFYIGNNANADGTYTSLRFGRGSPEYERRDATELAEAATGRRLTPADVSRYWTGQALAFIRSDPIAWITLLGRKTALLWNRTEMLDTESQETHAEWSTALRLLGSIGHFGVLVPLALLGAIVTWPSRHRLWVIYAIVVAYAASVVMFYVFARYRYPLVPFLLLFAAAGAVALPQLPRANARSATLAAAVLMAALFANWPILSTDLMRAITEHNLGTALQAEDRLDEAIEHYRRAIAIRPDYAPAYTNMGAALRAKGETVEAIATYERALALRPDYPEAHYNLANALLDDGKPEKAIEHFRKAIAATPASADIHNNLGIALATTGQSTEAIAQFREALRMDPDSPTAHRNLGDVLVSQGIREEGIEHLRRAVRLAPGDASVRYDLGNALLEAGIFHEATDQFHEALRLMPGSAEAHNNLGIALASQGQFDAAIEQFESALIIQPTFEEAERNLASVRRGRPSGRPDNDRPAR